MTKQPAPSYSENRGEAWLANLIKNLEAERLQLQGTQTSLERNAVQALHNAARLQSEDLKRQTDVRERERQC